MLSRHANTARSSAPNFLGFFCAVCDRLRSILIAPPRKKRRARHGNVFYETLEVRAMLDADGDDDGSGSDDDMDGDTGEGDMPTDGGSPIVNVVAGSGPEGTSIPVTITWSGAGHFGGEIDYQYGGLQAEMDGLCGLISGTISDIGDSGSATFYLHTFNGDVEDPAPMSGETDGGDDFQAVAEISTAIGGTAGNTTIGSVTEDSTAQQCICSCDCQNVEPTLGPQNFVLVNSGQGADPQDLGFNGAELPHAIVTVDDTLSSTVSSASDIMVQTVLTDMEGDVEFTSSPATYSPAGYTAGQAVEFSTEVDGAGLTSGMYESTTYVTEQYPDGSTIQRSYTNFTPVRNLDSSPYGDGWTLRNVDLLAPDANGAAVMYGTGNAWYFSQDDSGDYTLPETNSPFASLTKNTDGTYTLGFKDGSQEKFSAAGLPSSKTTSDGTQTLYDWNTDGTLHSVTDPRGTGTFAYSGGELTSFTDFAGRVTDYTITSGRLTNIELPAPGDGETDHSTTISYDSTTGMPTAITDAGGTTSLVYNSYRQVTSIEEPDGTTTSYSDPSSATLGSTSLVYASSVEGSTTDPNGHTSYYTVDPATGLTTSTTDATGTNTTFYQFNDQGLCTQISQPSLTTGGSRLITSMSYDANGNLVEEDFPDGSSESWVYDTAWNEPTSFVDAAGRQTDYTLDATNGNILTVTQVGTGGDPNLVTTYTYTPAPTGSGDPPAGLVATMVDPRGIETDFHYDSHGDATSIVYAVGTTDEASVSFTYDTNQNLASYSNELGLTTDYVFDAMNRKVEEQDPPPDSSDPSVRPTWTWVYDTRGNMLSQQDPMLRTTSYVYGAGSDGDEPDLDQMIQPDPAGGTSYTVTTYGHDDAENITSITDPLSRVESIVLDADNRQTSVTLPNPATGGSGGPSESVVYNALGFAVQQFDFLGGETDNSFNWRGQVLTTTGPAPTTGAARPTETFTYNADGQVLTDQNARGATTQYVYNSFGWLTEEILPPPTSGASSVTLQWGYDKDGDVVSYQDGNGNTYSYVYNNRNEMVEEDEPSPDGGTTPGPVWHWVYNAAQELVETLDPMSRETQFVHDGDGNVIQTIAPNLSTGGAGDASTTTFDTYDLDNEKTSETVPGGATTYFAFNYLGQMTQETQPPPTRGASSPVWQFQLDKDGELLQETNPLALTQTSTFNGLGQLTSQVSFAGQETDWTYNAVGEALTSTLVAASGSGLSNETTTNTWDALGRELTTTTAAGTTTMGYNLTGQMTSLEDADSNTTSWQVDAWGRPISETNPAGYSETFGYDNNSNLTQQVDFNGQTRQFVFNDLNQETAEKWVSGSSVLNTISTAFNADGQVVSTGDNFSDYAFGYNGQGDLASVDNSGTPGAPHVVLTSDYNAQGERTSLAATIGGTADLLNSYSYTALGQLDQVQQQGQTGGNAVAPKTVYLGLDAIGDITEIDYANSVTDGPYESGPGYATLSYSSTTGQLTGINDLHMGTSLDDLTYGYDGLGRVSTFSSIDGTATYGYDNTSQVVSASFTTASGGHQPANVSFSWDANGNNDASGVTVRHNEVTNDGTFTYTFDHNGNRTSRQRISSASASDYLVTFSWDYRNRLTDVEFFNNSDVLTKHVHYVYDIYNNLIEEDIDPAGSGSYTTVEQFALDIHPQLPVQVLSLSGTIDPNAPDDTLLEFVNGDLAERFFSAPSPSGADVIYAQGAVGSLTVDDVVDWLFVNNQGSPTDMVDSTGTPVNHIVYSPFGQDIYESDPSVTHFQGYAAGIADPNTGLIKFGERWYDPRATVWISVDPAGFLAGDANTVRYVRNNPAMLDDLSGLDEETADPVTNAPIGAPPEIQVAIGDLTKQPLLVGRLVNIANQNHNGNEAAGYICWNKAVQRLVVIFSGDQSQNTPGQSNRGIHFPRPIPVITTLPGLGPVPIAPGPIIVVPVVGNSPFLGNPPKTGPGGKLVPDPNLIIYYGWHTHPQGRDNMPSQVDCDNAEQYNLVEIVVYYWSNEDGEQGWNITIVGTDGVPYPWQPPELPPNR